MKIVSIHQPHYFPWFGLLEKIAQSNVFVILDNVQFNKRSYQHRALYSTNAGEKYLTIPVHSKGHQINNLQLKDLDFAEEQSSILERQYETLRHRYSKTKGWKLSEDKIEDFFLNKVYQNAYHLIVESMLLTLDLFQIQKEIVFASDLNATGSKNDLLIDILKKLDADVYLSGTGAKAYLNEEQFKSHELKIIYQNFEHPIYKQKIKGEFILGCMALDYYFENPEEAIQYMKGKLI